MGTDGVLEVLGVADDELTIGILNPDGSHAEMSGNGTRIAAAWLMSRTGAEHVRVLVGERAVEVRRTADGLYESQLGPVVVGLPELVDGIELTTVSVGNPHAVVLDDPARVQELGPRLERHPRFPEGTNVQIARIDGPGEVTARVWERGVGETAASGTSAIAVAAATHADGEVVVHFPGGDLRVRLAGAEVWLVGPAEPMNIPGSGEEVSTDP